MKVKELISILNACEPESEVSVQLGKDGEYRKACALIASGRIKLSKPDLGIACLKHQIISGAIVDGVECTLITEQSYFSPSLISSVLYMDVDDLEKKDFSENE